MTPTTINEPASLEEVLRYRHPGVVRRYAKEHHATPEEAAELFREMLKWLYLCGRGATDGPDGLALAIHPEIEKIDEMWHAFLLFTLDYADFCDRHFGFFLHHVPNEDDEEGAPPEESAVRAALERQYAFVYDVLGEETVTAWYGDCRYAAAS
jgi:hypothetical protein